MIHACFHHSLHFSFTSSYQIHSPQCPSNNQEHEQESRLQQEHSHPLTFSLNFHLLKMPKMRPNEARHKVLFKWNHQRALGSRLGSQHIHQRTARWPTIGGRGGRGEHEVARWISLACGGMVAVTKLLHTSGCSPSRGTMLLEKVSTRWKVRVRWQFLYGQLRVLALPFC